MRTRHGADTPPDLRPRRFGSNGWGVLLVLVLGLILGLFTRYGREPQAPPAAVEEDVPLGPPTPNVHVALHLDEPLRADETVVWTVAFQAAWDRLADALGLAGGIHLGPPARPEAVRALNAGRLPPGVVDPGDLTVIAGPDDDATRSAVARSSDRPFPAYERDPDNPAVVAFARLRASLRYETPFFPAERPLAFGPRGTLVRAWGLHADARGPVPDAMREQARLHLPEGTYPEEAARRGVVVLRGRGGKRLVLSMRPPQATLRATWEDAAAVLASTEAQTFSVVDTLSVPRVALVAERSYDEIAPAFFTDLDAQLVVARQHLSLTVDERGADVDAEAVLVALGAVPLRVVLDGPFLVALLATGSDEPYVLAWIGSDDALSPWGGVLGRTLDAIEVRPFAGAWTLDERASIDATAAAWERLLPEGWREHAAKSAESNLRSWRFELDVQADGEARVTSDRPHEDVRTAAVPLRRDGARVLLALPWGDGGGPRTWVVSREEERLLLSIPSQGVRLVLRRR